MYLNLGLAFGFAEDRFAGHTIRIGDKVLLAILECDPRCKMIAFDPETAKPNPEVMK